MSRFTTDIYICVCGYKAIGNVCWKLLLISWKQPWTRNRIDFVHITLTCVNRFAGGFYVDCDFSSGILFANSNIYIGPYTPHISSYHFYFLSLHGISLSLSLTRWNCSEITFASILFFAVQCLNTFNHYCTVRFPFHSDSPWFVCAKVVCFRILSCSYIPSLYFLSFFFQTFSQI